MQAGQTPVFVMSMWFPTILSLAVVPISICQTLRPNGNQGEKLKSQTSPLQKWVALLLGTTVWLTSGG